MRVKSTDLLNDFYGAPRKDQKRRKLTGVCLAAILSTIPGIAFGQQGQIDTSGQESGEQVMRGNASFGGYVLSVSPRVTYSDNVELDSEGQEQEDGLASVVVQGGLLLDRVNFTGIVNGRVEIGTYFDPPTVAGEDLYDRVVVDQNIQAGATAEFIDNFLYLDVAGVTERQALDEGSRFSSQTIAANDQQADSYAFSISPYISTAFSNESSLEVRYRYINILIDDNDAVDGIDDFLNDSETHEALAEYDSGRLLDRLSFSLRAYVNQTEETGSDVLAEVDYDQASGSGSIAYPLSRKLSVIGTVGYDDIDTNNNPLFDDDELSGVFWKAGFVATPGRRTDLRLEVGERYDGFLVEADAEYRYSSRLRFRGNINRTFNTANQLRSRNSSILQSETLSFAEELRLLQDLTASEVLERSLQFNSDLQDLSERNSGLATSNNASIAVLANTSRSDFVLRLGYDDADFGFEKTDTVSLSGAWTRQMSRNLDIFVRGTYQNTSTDISGSTLECITALSSDPATAGLSDAAIAALCLTPENLDDDTQTASVLAGFGYRLFKDVSAFVQVARTQRFADTEDQEFEENAVTAGLTVDL